MKNILSFYEDIAISTSFESDLKCFEIISIKDETQHHQIAINPDSAVIRNVLNFARPIQRSNDIVEYLIKREQLQTV